MNSSSILQEIQINVVSNSHLPKLFSKQNETQAGYISYPIRCTNDPACNNQGAEIDLSVVDGKHNRTGRRQARSSVIPIIRESELHVGSNPTHPIPASFANLFLPETGAGNFFNTLTPTLTPASTIIMRGN